MIQIVGRPKDVTIDPVTGETTETNDGQPDDPYGLRGLIGGNGGKGKTSSAILAQKKFQWDIGNALYERTRQEQKDKDAKAAVKLAKDNHDAMVKAMTQRFESGEYEKEFNDQLAGLDKLGENSAKAMSDQLGRSTGALNEGYAAAGDLTNSGYNTLDAFLQDNPNDPYAGQSVSGGQVGNDLQALLASQGANNDAVGQQVAATNANLNSGTQEMNNLLGLMSKIAQQSGNSRASESVMGRRAAIGSLAQQRAGGIDNLTNAHQSALQQMWNGVNQQKMGVNANASQYKRSLIDQLIQLGVSPGAPTIADPKEPLLDDVNEGEWMTLEEILNGGMPRRSGV